MKRDYHGKVVAITGATGGIGAALCRVFAGAGAQVAMLDLAAEKVQAQAQELATEFNIKVVGVVTNVADRVSCEQAMVQVRAGLGPVDCLINNAGITHLGSFAPEFVDDVRRVMEVNFFGSVYCTAACLADLQEQQGQIIVLSSVAGFAPLLGRSAYSASKHALHGFFESLRAEAAGSGLGVLMVCPSFVATGIRSAVTDKGDTRHTTGAELSPDQVATAIFKAACADRDFLPLGRVGRISWRLHRLSPALYEKIMRRRFAVEK